MTACRGSKAGYYAPELGIIDKAADSHVPLGKLTDVPAFSSDLNPEPRLVSSRLQLLTSVMSTGLW